MTSTHDKVGYLPQGKPAKGKQAQGKQTANNETLGKQEMTAKAAADGVEHAVKLLEGRWKLVILFHLFGGKLLRFSELEKAIPAISQKMLIQQLRQMEEDGIVRRIVHHQVPPKVEYGLTDWGQALCPALDALLKWAALREVGTEANIGGN
jgi:DNA-binding HxlR family transcriptional regulator